MLVSSKKGKSRRLQQWVAGEILRIFPWLSSDDVRSAPMGVTGADVQLSSKAKANHASKAITMILSRDNMDVNTDTVDQDAVEHTALVHYPFLPSPCHYSRDRFSRPVHSHLYQFSFRFLYTLDITLLPSYPFTT